MDPLLDEKFVLTIAQIIPDYFQTTLFIRAEREAYGPSKNEGICYESCSKVGFIGEINGAIFLCMDGYTKLKILPRIARSFQIDPTTRTHSSSVILEFTNQIAARIINEMKEGRFELDILPPENFNNKVIIVDLKIYRQYILIFHLSDRREHTNLGRIYIILLLEKYPNADKKFSKETTQSTS